MNASKLDRTIIPQTSIDDVKFSEIEEYIKSIRKRGFEESMRFFTTNLLHVQAGQNSKT